MPAANTVQPASHVAGSMLAGSSSASRWGRQHVLTRCLSLCPGRHLQVLGHNADPRSRMFAAIWMAAPAVASIAWTVLEAARWACLVRCCVLCCAVLCCAVLCCGGEGRKHACSASTAAVPVGAAPTCC